MPQKQYSPEVADNVTLCEEISHTKFWTDPTTCWDYSEVTTSALQYATSPSMCLQIEKVLDEIKTISVKFTATDHKIISEKTNPVLISTI